MGLGPDHPFIIEDLSSEPAPAPLLGFVLVGVSGALVGFLAAGHFATAGALFFGVIAGLGCGYLAREALL
ncbi:MAG TPA: hypothetical protein DHE23_01670 [Agrobacterium sp.]|jgi:hypothetical protein|nr:hypothetical protein [Agrobacterium sp.]